VTGAAGFIGYHLSRRLLEKGAEVVGLDSLNDYYDPALKKARLARLEGNRAFRFVRLDITDGPALEDLVARERPSVLVNLAAQVGVRYSLENPRAYVQSNLVGFLNVLEACRRAGTGHLVYASSSSVYGANLKTPFSVADSVDHPVSLYAATKKADELMAHAYSHVYGLPCTGLRFFTVYGPWGRPDMAYFLFARRILAGEPIEVFDEGRMERDFTYVDDIVEAVTRLMERPPAPDPAWDPRRPDPGRSSAPWRVYNIGNSRPVRVADFIAVLERVLGLKARRVFKPAQPGEVAVTCADVSDLERDFGFRPSTPLEKGLAAFVRWFKEYAGVGVNSRS
jgi:UDP-glucuronate 4-epimerase